MNAHSIKLFASWLKTILIVLAIGLGGVPLVAEAVPTEIARSANYDIGMALDAAALSKLAYTSSYSLSLSLSDAGWTPLSSEHPTYVSLDAGGGLSYLNAYAFAATRQIGNVQQFAISFRGTDGNNPAYDGATHGFSQYYSAIRPVLEEALNQALEAKAVGREVQIILTGHSLGGAAVQAALLDMLIPKNQDVWSYDGSTWLDTNHRLGSSSGSGVNFDGQSWDTLLQQLLPNTVAYTFGAPSISADALGVTPHLNSTDLTYLQNNLFQFEHKDSNPIYQGDSVAMIGTDYGSVINIDVTTGIHLRYVSNSVLGMHSMDNYQESILRAIDNLPLFKPDTYASSQPVPPAWLDGGAENDLIVGTTGSETLHGYGGNDILLAQGNDTMIGGAGNDTYVINADSGELILSDSGGFDRILFGKEFTGITVHERQGNDARLVLQGVSGNLLGITIQNWYTSNANHIEVLDFMHGNPLNNGVGNSLTFGAMSLESIIPKLPTLYFSPTYVLAVSEGDSGTTNMVFPVTRSGDLSHTSSVQWTVTGYFAHQVSASDFVGNVLPSGTINFAPGESTQNITLQIAGDTVQEQDEHFIVTLSAPVDATIGQTNRLGTILNDDTSNGNHLPTGMVTISGTPTLGQTLTASNTLADADGIASAIGYQWQADGTDISGATNNTYALTAAEIGKSITAVASYTDGLGTPETATSAPIAAVNSLVVDNEPTGNVTTSAALTMGAVINGAIEQAGDHDWFRVNLVSGANYQFNQAKTTGSALDSYLRLRDSSGNQLVFNDDGGGNYNARLTYTPTQTGTYYLDAGGFDDGSTGSYTLSASIIPANHAPSFAVGDGKVTTAIDTGSEGRSVTVQTDGKILVAGSSWGNDGRPDFALVRYNTDGSLDISFDGDGKVTTNIMIFNSDLKSDDRGKSVTVQADGKILVAGDSYHGGRTDIALARYNVDGSLDTSFGTDGRVTTAIGWVAVGSSAIVQSNGKILVAGSSAGSSDIGGNPDYDFALVRYNTDGSLDGSFGAGGKVTTNFGSSSDGSNSVTVQADGKILVAGVGNRIFGLARYNTDGSLDTSFDGDGKVTTEFDLIYSNINSVIVQSDGKILAAGDNNGHFALARYNTDGSLDTSFGTGGKVTSYFGTNYFSHSSTLQSDGKILVAGIYQNGFALARYNTDGSLDTTFDTDGLVTTYFGYMQWLRCSVTVQADGKILVAGTSPNNSFALARYNTDGSLDTGFGHFTNTPLNGTPTYTENGSAVVLDSDVQIVDAELAASGNYSGASLTLARNGGANAQDVFSNTGTLGALTQGGNLTVGGTPIGTVTTHSGGTLTLTFNSSATQSLVNSAMQQIAYSNSSNTPPASVQIDWTFNDGNTGAQGTGGALAVTGSTTVSITSVQSSQTIGTISFSPTTLAMGGSTTASATATSGLLVSFSSTTPSVCTVSGSTITGVAAGTCTIAANQAGNTNYNAAVQVTQSITVAPTTLTASTNAGANGSITPASQTVTQGNTTSFTVTPITGYTAFASGCGGSLNGSTYTTGTITADCTVSATFVNFIQASLVTGWNLLGNSVNAPLDVAATLGDTTKVTTVWKWIPATSKWAFYAPSMTAPNLATYAASKGYDVLTTVNGGEGFWVNAKIPFTVSFSMGTSISTSNFADQTTPPNKLPMGWSLIAVGDNPSPRNFVNVIAISQPVLPAVAATSITTLWAWDSGLSSWYFYAPSLDNNGALANYITTKGYLDFTAKGKTLDPAMGFWVNHP